MEAPRALLNLAGRGRSPGRRDVLRLVEEGSGKGFEDGDVGELLVGVNAGLDETLHVVGDHGGRPGTCATEDGTFYLQPR